MDVSKLIAELAGQGVASFKGYGIEVSFHSRLAQPIVISGPALGSNPPDQSVKQDAAKLPDGDAGLAQSMEAELSYDKVLNWSASPDPTEQQTPLTGDAVPVTNEQV